MAMLYDEVNTDNERPTIDKRIKELVAAQFEDFLTDLQLITNIDSGTGHAAGSAAIAAFLKQRLEEINGTVEFRTNEKGTHVIARFKGRGSLKILFMAHTDTVFASGESKKRPFRVDENLHAYGPGVGDDKATVIQTLYVMKALKDIGFNEYGEITLYYNAEEEIGSVLAESIVDELARQADVVIVMDTARPGWGIVTQRKGSASYEIQIQGIAGHAGNAAQAAASAIMELGNQISQLYQMASPLPGNPLVFSYESLLARGVMDYGQFIPTNTINVGVIGTSNKKTNVVPADAYAQVEVRCFSTSELERIDREIRNLAAKTVVPGTIVRISGGIEEHPMEKTPKAQEVIDAYKAIVKQEYGATVVEWLAGGMTDGNRSSRYAPTIDALGIETYDEHTEHEYADLNTVVPRTVALIQLIRFLAAD